MRSLRLITVLVSLLTALLIMHATSSTATTISQQTLAVPSATTISQQTLVVPSTDCATEPDTCAFLPLTRFPALPPMLQQVGVVPAPLAAIEVRGSYAYAMHSASLYSIDVSNPAEPRVVGGLQLPDVEYPYAVMDIEVEPPFVYVSTRKGYSPFQIHLIDISQPAQPRWITGIAGIGGGDLEVIDRRVYATNSSWDIDPPTFSIIDVVNASTFELRGTFESTGNSSMTIKDSIAYVPNFGNGLLMIDISIPDDLTVVGTVSTPDDMYGIEQVEIDGSYLYAVMPDALAVFDIHVPQAPVLRSIRQLSGGFPIDLEVADGLAYVAFDTGTFSIVDVRDPDQMELVLTDRVAAGSLHDVEIDGSLLYLASSMDLYIMRVTRQ